ncbi:MAG: Gfo/Idh/MocA family protein [Limnochordia bacterium]|jgi:UDP-N-acetyl-2-amino-2-deoxyglucuronate dehydrogenase
MSKSVGYAVVGLGVGRAHARAAAKAKDCRLVAVCDIDRAKADAVAAELNCEAIYDFDELLKRSDVDVVSIATPSGMHSDMIVKAAEAGKHILAEKPLDITLDKIDVALEACRKHNVKLGAVFQNRLNPASQAIKEAISQGALGRTYLANVQVKWWRTQEYYEKDGGWRGTWAMDGGGSLMNQSVHTIDLLQWFMGPVKSVFAFSDIFAHDIETEDAAVAAVRFENGAIGSIIGTTAAYPGLDTTVQIHGENGTIYMTDAKIKRWAIRGPQEKEVEAEMIARFAGKGDAASADPSAIATTGHAGQVQDMVYAVLEDRDPVIVGSEARHAVEIILAIYESARTGKQVFLK